MITELSTMGGLDFALRERGLGSISLVSRRLAYDGPPGWAARSDDADGAYGEGATIAQAIRSLFLDIDRHTVLRERGLTRKVGSAMVALGEALADAAADPLPGVRR